MKRFIVLDKKVGDTPLAAIQKWKAQNPRYADIPASYAGRLDPMASGKLLVLLGNECTHQRAYIDLDKEYDIEVLLDIGSDTGDVLGLSEYAHTETHLDEQTLANVLHQELGAHMRAYPAFSSKTVSGKPLFLHTLEGTLPDIVVPKHVERIYKIQNKGSYPISSLELETRITSLLNMVPRTNEPSKQLGKDFRIDAVRTQWKSVLKTAGETQFIVLRLNITSASGTYMRSLAGRIGTSLDTSALALSIRRTTIGTYIPLLRTGFWLHTY